jgi:predicted CXXCH cytochrome family protein
MLRKAKLLKDGSIWPRIVFADVGPHCAYCHSPHLARPVSLLPDKGPVERTTLCFACRLDAVGLGYKVLLPAADLS